ncbi:MAG: ribosome maturation factor RimP [SAR324 cluster bacterium]|nr:ribosome maturation factor RimP [SAR324 cluster bacterium]
MSKLVDSVEQLIKPAIEQAGFELIEIEYKKEGSQWFLRIYIDHPEGISLDHCVSVNSICGSLMDTMDSIPDEYIMEVSSPGLFRVLNKPSHYENVSGQRIKIKLFQPIDGKKQYLGKLLFVDGDGVKIHDEQSDKDLVIPYRCISRSNLEPELKF